MDDKSSLSHWKVEPSSQWWYSFCVIIMSYKSMQKFQDACPLNFSIFHSLTSNCNVSIIYLFHSYLYLLLYMKQEPQLKSFRGVASHTVILKDLWNVRISHPLFIPFWMSNAMWWCQRSEAQMTYTTIRIKSNQWNKD